jgi:hypothetical protein
MAHFYVADLTTSLASANGTKPVYHADGFSTAYGNLNTISSITFPSPIYGNPINFFAGSHETFYGFRPNTFTQQDWYWSSGAGSEWDGGTSTNVETTTYASKSGQWQGTIIYAGFGTGATAGQMNMRFSITTEGITVTDQDTGQDVWISSSVEIYMSTNAGATWGLIAGYSFGSGSGGWYQPYISQNYASINREDIRVKVVVYCDSQMVNGWWETASATLSISDIMYYGSG